MSLFDQLGMYWRFAWDLRKFLKDKVTVEQAQKAIRERLENREHNLLTIVKEAVYDNENSPYLKLLKLAGCEYFDFERMVLSDGIEPALKKLYQDGVYLTIEEFKGKKEISRGNKVFHFKTSAFDNPFLSRHLETISGGSRSAGTRTIYDLDFVTVNFAYIHKLVLDAHEALDLPVALWAPIIGGGPIAMLSYTKGGFIPEKWFSQVEKRGFKPSLKHRFLANYMVFISRISGVNMPGPEYVPLDEAYRVAQWVVDAIKRRGGCVVGTYVSAAVRICQAAKEKGLDIAGAKFIIAGEPLTEVKRKEIESVGVRALPEYFFIEAGLIGAPCFRPTAADDYHLTSDSLVLIQQPREVPHAAASVDAFLFTTLLPSTPKVLLNVESGDYGVFEKRHCGCKLDELGLTEHIYNIRGFDKLTGEGMTFVGTDMVRIIEEVLPARFGGASTDYQIVEEEDEKGQTRMSVIVSPEVGAIDEDELIQTVLAELGKGKDTQRMMAQIWSQAKTLRVKRMRPIATARGKLLPLHIQKSNKFL
jgi:hypothetical protein